MPLSRRIEDYAVVTLITLLIWFYAESQTLVSDQTGAMELIVRPASPNLAVVDQAPGRVNVWFSGAANAVGRLKASLGEELTVRLDASELEPGETHERPLERLL